MAKKKNGSKQGHMKSTEDVPSSDDDSVSSEEEGEDLILEGVLVRNPDMESSDESDNEEDDEPGPVKKKAKADSNGSKNSKGVNSNASKKKAKEDGKSDGTEIIPVEFTFNDMNEKFFHGIKNHLLSQPVYAPFSSALSDAMIENVSVGTVVSTDDGESNVFGFASVLNVTTNGNKDAIKSLKKLCINGCPKEHKAEMETVLSGKTKRPAGMMIHGRMVNLPLEITLVLHEQLVLDMDWAVKNAHGGEKERKSLDFGAFVVLAPCTRDNNTHALMYKNFDDEIFAGCSEFVYTISTSELNKLSGIVNGGNDNDGELTAVIVCTKTGHRQGMKELKTMIHG
mmetsp:Transcript_138/g.162  ORF Transcript_138/g.162 Transcript_138/m.162 type:complete len:340 (+) Transcript_138:77-1096(+)